MTVDTEMTTVLVRCQARTFPPYDAFHGTPHAMQWRKVTIETSKGTAAFEQSDYGHPGRWTAWEPRGVHVSLTPRLAELRALAEAAATLL